MNWLDFKKTEVLGKGAIHWLLDEYDNAEQ